MGLKTDVTKRYIEWAIEAGFQVIDINIPKMEGMNEVNSTF